MESSERDIAFQIVDGKVREYKEPYATIELETEEDFNRLQELLELGEEYEELMRSEDNE